MEDERTQGGDAGETASPSATSTPSASEVPCAGPPRGAGEMQPGDWRTPNGMTPDDIVSSGGSGTALTPPSGAMDDGRRDP